MQNQSARDLASWLFALANTDANIPPPLAAPDDDDIALAAEDAPSVSDY